MPVLYLYYLFISFSVTLFIMPVLFRLLEKFNVFDKPNHRKIHISKKLTGGGAILFFSFLGSFFLVRFKVIAWSIWNDRSLPRIPEIPEAD